jgi:hypothetical protein
MPDSDTAYIRGLVSVLRKRDVDELRAFLKEEATIRDTSRANEIDSIDDESLESRMYKMILARKELTDLHADARRWLNEHGVEVRF